MSESFLKSYNDPGYWRDTVEEDLGAPCRHDWEAFNARADELLKGETGKDKYWLAAYPRTRKSFSGRLFYGPITPRVTGVEIADESTARMYQAAIQWEFSRPRGLRRAIGREELRPALFNWIDYGMGCVRSYFDYRVRDRENYTGSIVTEHVFSPDIILDSTATRLSTIQHLSRKYELNEEQLQSMFPAFRGDAPFDEDGKCWLYEVQFRTHKPVKARMNSAELSSITQDYSSYYTKRGDFIGKFAQDRNDEAEKLWRGMKQDWISLPMVYSIVFLSGKEEDSSMSLIQQPVYVGSDFDYKLIGFAERPGSPYPVGAPYFLEGLIQMASDLKALYVRLAQRLNNSGGAIDVTKIVGSATDVISKMREAKRMITDNNYWIFVQGVNNMNEVFKQMEIVPPQTAIIEAAAVCEEEIKEFFNTHREQLGQSPYSGAPAKLVEMLQATGGFALGDSVDSMKNFTSAIFRQIASLIYRYMPSDKRIAVSDLADDVEMMVLQKEQMQKYDPQELDITVDLDTDSEREKINRAGKAQVATQMGFMGPLRYLKENGYSDPERILQEVADYRTGMQMVAAMKADPGLAQMMTEYTNMKTLQAQTQET